MYNTQDVIHTMGQNGAKILCPNPSTMQQFWHKLNYFFVLPNFEILFITRVKKIKIFIIN